MPGTKAPSRATWAFVVVALWGCKTAPEAEPPPHPQVPAPDGPARVEASGATTGLLDVSADSSTGEAADTTSTTGPGAVVARHWVEDWRALATRNCKAFAGALGEGVRAAKCELQLDLDGDGKKERLFQAREKGGQRSGFVVQWSSGRESVVGAGHEVTLYPGANPDSDAHEMQIDEEYFVVWKRVERTPTGARVPVLRRKVDVALPDAVGDVMFVSGTDAAILIYFDGDGFRWHHMGF
ncbi:MAG: hypothetical protein AAF721_16740 [Myxococcota bacterium]